jgi:hypothetical protein
MTHTERVFSLLLAAALLLTVTSTPAEVRGGRNSSTVYVLVLSITEGPDPVVSWEPIWDWEGGGGKPLNPGGETRGDGRPDVAIDPTTGWPLVSWAYWAGTDYDIAYAEWEGLDWSEVDFITSSVENQLDPRSHIDEAGRVRTVWWEQVQSGKLYLAVREPGEALWTTPQLIHQSGRRPSVVPDGEDLLVAFEEDGPRTTQRVSLLTLLADGGSQEITLATTDRIEPLDVIIHEAGGVFWMEWKHSDEFFAYSVRSAEGWSDPVMVPWTEHSWLGEEELRKIIRTEVLFP